MKKNAILASILASISISGSAFAYPGDTYNETLNWIKNHQFLSSQFIGPLSGMDFWKIIAFRQLQDNVFLDVELHYDSQVNGDKKAKLWEESLYLVRRKYNPNKAIDEYSDKRPWEDEEYLHIWTRDNPKAHLILSHVYDKEMANDFEKSKLIFHGNEYTEEAPMSYYRRDLPEVSQYKIFAWTEDVKIFLGNQYGFEVSNTGVMGKTPYFSLKIISKIEAQNSANILAKNLKIYQKYLEKEKTKQKRNAPSDIKI
ncbi:MAG: hypothetical protein IV090_25020 [Candidatus Sericytochromatia bacterium]|nr:hypothetical protein [Candidatus Sericytochromatia bacterium]